ncbi:MAG: type II secretion system protein [Sphingomonadaceae bacterium]|jgi:prepilin-type N-terminal cleavage/methylation domain-containing protein|nr:type II secretion system protein [Sphingomonadaceae bacterium]
MRSKPKQLSGFTLVEISIVMIIVGLLIGGTFGGMKLIENMQVNKTVQDLKSLQSATITFRDVYRALPGDIRNPAARLSNCSDAPCATGGDGSRSIGIINMWGQSITAADENFTYFHHLEAAGLTNLGIKNTTNMEFGEGQPEAAIGGGFRMVFWNNRSVYGVCQVRFPGHGFFITGESSGNAPDGPLSRITPCSKIEALDRKMDDGMPLGGKVQSYCVVAYVCDTQYPNTGIDETGYVQLF